jgi:hypothetical protein
VPRIINNTETSGKKDFYPPFLCSMSSCPRHCASYIKYKSGIKKEGLAVRKESLSDSCSTRESSPSSPPPPVVLLHFVTFSTFSFFPIVNRAVRVSGLGRPLKMPHFSFFFHGVNTFRFMV